MKKICETKPMIFEGYLILALSIEWIEVFGEIPTFEASLDNNGKLHLISTKSVDETRSKVRQQLQHS